MRRSIKDVEPDTSHKLFRRFTCHERPLYSTVTVRGVVVGTASCYYGSQVWLVKCGLVLRTHINQSLRQNSAASSALIHWYPNQQLVQVDLFDERIAKVRPVL